MNISIVCTPKRSKKPHDKHLKQQWPTAWLPTLDGQRRLDCRRQRHGAQRSLSWAAQEHTRQAVGVATDSALAGLPDGHGLRWPAGGQAAGGQGWPGQWRTQTGEVSAGSLQHVVCLKVFLKSCSVIQKLWIRWVDTSFVCCVFHDMPQNHGLLRIENKPSGKGCLWLNMHLKFSYSILLDYILVFYAAGSCFTCIYLSCIIITHFFLHFHSLL